MLTDSTRRSLALGVLAIAIVLAGCSNVPFLGEESCGPGETEIGAIEGNVSETEIKGELVAITNSSLVIDDGTGRAEILLLFEEDVTSQVSEGDCLIAAGSASEPEDDEGNVTMLATDLWKEE